MVFGSLAPSEPPSAGRGIEYYVQQTKIARVERMRKGFGACHIYASSASNVKMSIDGLEEKLARCRQSVEEVDLKLRREKLSSEGRKSLERERNLLMTKADNYEKELSTLRKENRKNAALAVAVGLLIALIYACWMM
ncbi:PREDICTED: coiled-coil domain-containing protein 167 [Nestor notabilis]|uniref:coiled-coil domain-containing protein 167 n=1 Tax=Nestor notabilis TaxID=176057 RepID=UPI00052341FF|nr:PREDICTED: coiled-coil domain-containing protein 167 [Nestor notabilis]